VTLGGILSKTLEVQKRAYHQKIVNWSNVRIKSIVIFGHNAYILDISLTMGAQYSAAGKMRQQNTIRKIHPIERHQ
jgi:hypothetical protein